MGGHRRLKIILILLSIVTVYASVAWYSPKVISGFPLERFGRLSHNISTDGNIIRGFRSFPFAAGYLATLSAVTGLSVMEIAYIPFVIIFSFVCCLTFSQMIGRNIWAPLFAGGVFLFWFYNIAHFQEYPIAMSFYLLFAYFIYRYLGKVNDRRFLGIVMILYGAIKFYGQPYEVWALSLIGFLLILLYIARKLDPEHQQLKNIVNHEQSFMILAIFGVVSFLAYNQKLYGQFLVYRLDSDGRIIDAIQAVGQQIFETSSGQRDLVYTTPSPFLINRINTVWALLIVGTIATIFLYYLFSNRGKYWKHGFGIIFAIATTLASSIRMSVYVFVGAGLPLRYVVTVWPLLAGYFVKTHARNLLPYFAVLIFVLPLITSGATTYAVNERPLTDSENLNDADKFLYYNTPEDSGILLDYKQHGELRAISGQEGRIEDSWEFVPIDDENIRELYLLKELDENSHQYDYIALNYQFAEYPLQAGWWEYEPLSFHEDNVTNAKNKNKVYQNRYIMIYQRNE